MGTHPLALRPLQNTRRHVVVHLYLVSLTAHFEHRYGCALMAPFCNAAAAAAGCVFFESLFIFFCWGQVEVPIWVVLRASTVSSDAIFEQRWLEPNLQHLSASLKKAGRDGAVLFLSFYEISVSVRSLQSLRLHQRC